MSASISFGAVLLFAILRFKVNQKNTYLASSSAGLLGRKVKHDGTVFAGRKTEIDAVKSVEDHANTALRCGQHVNAK
ncbi:MAG: hypothetical protein IT562_10785 [Alphaproteobacteria bacterium]|nr:hypothetical protein [Alphaproteobacteria bacterium]